MMGAEASNVLLVGAPLLALVADVALHVVFANIGRPGKHLGPVILAFSGGLLALLAFTYTGLQFVAHTRRDQAAFVVLNAGAYGALGYCYFTFVNLTATSLRMRLLRELLKSTAPSLSTTALSSGYQAREVLDVRLDRLVKWGQIAVKNKRYVLQGTAFSVLSKIITHTRALIGIHANKQGVREK